MFIKSISLHLDARVVLVEGYQDSSSRLPDFSDRVLKHISVPVRDAIWIKESLINIGFHQLPPTWQYGAWIDRDVVFCNPNWIQETIEQLQTCDLIQPWRECCFLNDQHEHDPLEFGEWRVSKKDFAYSFCSVELSKHEHPSSPPRGYAHPGQAWAIRRDFFEKIGGLYDYSILGGGDGILMYAIQGRIDHPSIQLQGKPAITFVELLADCRIGYIHGLILHYYHGSLAKRRYLSRLDLYRKHNFDPLTFLTRDTNQMLCLTEKGNIMAADIRNYFSSREEDAPSNSGLSHEKSISRLPSWGSIPQTIRRFIRNLCT